MRSVNRRDSDLAESKKARDEPNRLIREKSPYLRQHAFNPVDWFPWGMEAFTVARRLDRPVFLSIGYSTCHWCHVMAHESFEDQEVARLMNDSFVSIKVDREERPDIDQVYMKVCQMMTGSGGWPLTVVMTPDKKPFFAATYLPKRSRFGAPGMVELLQRISELWEMKREDLLRSAEDAVDRLRSSVATAPKTARGGEMDHGTLNAAYQGLSRRFDWVNGGFGSAPKFPTPHNLSFLLRHWRRSGDPSALEMVKLTLGSMARGGIYDHVGFGFHRYSTDARWFLPHFEKMLYDQALLALAYTEAYQATSHEGYARTAGEVLDYVLRDMRSPEGGFYSAEDADSEGVEGKFYLWTREEIFSALSAEDAELVIRLFCVEEGGNFLDEASGRRSGGNVLSLGTGLKDAGSTSGVSEEILRRRLEAARKTLMEARALRVRPARDDKVLTDWNGLMIASLARARRAMGADRYVEAAKRAADFFLDKMHRNGTLLHRYRDGEAAIRGTLDDYAFLVWGLIELYQATFDLRYLTFALDLNSEMIEGFWDREDGGFFFTSRDDEPILVRQKEVHDGALPSGNSVAMQNLIRLGRMTGDPALEAMASDLARAFSGRVKDVPEAHPQLMIALDLALGPSYEVVVVGRPQAEDTAAMLKALDLAFLPNVVTLFVPDEGAKEVHEVAGFTRTLLSTDKRATAYVCTGGRCELPTTDVGEMLEILGANSKTAVDGVWDG